MSTYIPPQEPERKILKIEYDDIPGDRPDNTRTVYYWIENLPEGQKATVSKQKYGYNCKWNILSEETVFIPYDKVENDLLLSE
jgi:hypothetical protein